MFKSLAKDTLIYGGGDLVLKIIAFVTFPIIASALSPKAFGVLELLGTSTALLGLLMNCGLNNAVQRYYWDEETDLLSRPVIVSSGFVILCFFGLFIGGVTLVVGGPLFPHWVQKWALPVGNVAFVSSIGLMFSGQLLQYVMDVLRLHFAPFKFLLLSFLYRILGLFLGIFVLIRLKKGIDGFLFVQMIVAYLVLPFGLWLIRKDITRKFDLHIWGKRLVIFGYPFIFAGMAYWLFGSMDRWMLAAMASVEETGIYSVAFRFSSIVLFVNMAFSQAWTPYAIKIKTEHPETYRTFYVHILLIILFCMLIVGGGMALFSGELIGLFMPDDYVGSALPLSILCLGIVLQSTQQITALGIALEKKTFLFSRVAWLATFFNFLANWLLIPRFGAAGAAWATCISHFILTLGYLFFTQKLHPLPIPWGRLGWLLFWGGFVFFVAFRFNSDEWHWRTVSLKILFAFCCLLLGVPVLGVRIKNWKFVKEKEK
jgi:O-antigen/teichoic acid export membrane protein